MELSDGSQIAHYRVVGKLGSGGMGQVYAADDTKLKRRVALKVLPSEMAQDAEFRRRFEREAETIAALDHPNIVTIYSIEESDGVHFLTMPVLEGRTLGEIIPSGGMSTEDFFRTAIPLSRAVAAAHESGVIHRDLKPANVAIARTMVM